MKVHHMVLLRFRSEAADLQAARLFQALEGLRQTLPGILHFAGGPYRSPEGLNQGYTHGFLMTFADAGARDHYLTHPDHERVKEEFLPHLEGLVAFDFEEN